MAQFVAIDPNVEVNGQTVLTTVNAFPEYMRMIGISVLNRHGLEDISRENWYPQQSWLDAFREIGERYGSATLFEIGKAIPGNAQFPADIDNLEKALKSIDVAYHINHRNGKIGNYKLTSFDHSDKKAVMVCDNPYPSDFDRGIITAMARKFAHGESMITVELDDSKPSRKTGSDSCTYLISW